MMKDDGGRNQTDGQSWQFSLLRSKNITADDSRVFRFLTPELKAWCEQRLASFYFVKWDRFIRTKMQNGPHMLTCYGWIDREGDAYKDFLVIDLVLDDRRVNYVVSSSAKYNLQISELCGYDAELSKNCVRVESEFDVQNMVKLKERKKEE